MTDYTEIVERAKAVLATYAEWPMVVAVAADVVEMAEELKGYEQSFDLRWKADMRAIERWRSKVPGKELTLPDHADLCTWELALFALERALAEIEALAKERCYGCRERLIGKRLANGEYVHQRLDLRGYQGCDAQFEQRRLAALREERAGL